MQAFSATLLFNFTTFLMVSEQSLSSVPSMLISVERKVKNQQQVGQESMRETPVL